MPTILEEILISRGWSRRIKSPNNVRDWQDDQPDCIDRRGQDRMRLIRYAAKDLSDKERKRCEAHLAKCTSCRNYLDDVAPSVVPQFRRLARAEASRRRRRGT
jgi:hypothetical protein